MERILQWNIREMTAGKQDLLRLIEDFKPNIIAIQETFYGDNFMNKINNYNGICKQGHYNERYHGGLSLYFHSSCTYRVIEIQSQYQVVAAHLQPPQTRAFTVVSIYIPGSKEVSQDELTNISRQLLRPFIILEDLNSHSQLWGNQETTVRGRIVETFLTDNQLLCLSDGRPTHQSGTAIDLSIASPEMGADIQWNRYPSALSSDHHPIVLSVEGRGTEPAQRYNCNKANWSLYYVDQAWEGLPDLEREFGPEAVLEDLTRRILSAADRHVASYVPQNHYPRPQWNAQCEHRRQREQLYRQYKQTARQDIKLLWRRARAICKRLCRQSKREAFQKYVGEMKCGVQMGTIYDKLRRLRGRPPRKVRFLQSD